MSAATPSQPLFPQIALDRIEEGSIRQLAESPPRQSNPADVLINLLEPLASVFLCRVSPHNSNHERSTREPTVPLLDVSSENLRQAELREVRRKLREYEAEMEANGQSL